MSMLSKFALMTLIHLTVLPGALYGQNIFPGISTTDGGVPDEPADLDDFWSRPITRLAGPSDRFILSLLSGGIRREKPGALLEDARQEALAEALRQFWFEPPGTQESLRAKAESIGRAATRAVKDSRRQSNRLPVRHGPIDLYMGTQTPPMEEMLDETREALQEIMARHVMFYKDSSDARADWGINPLTLSLWSQWLEFEGRVREHFGEDAVEWVRTERSQWEGDNHLSPLDLFGSIAQQRAEEIRLRREEMRGLLREGRHTRAEAEEAWRRFEEQVRSFAGDAGVLAERKRFGRVLIPLGLRGPADSGGTVVPKVKGNHKSHETDGPPRRPEPRRPHR